jgi:hypothetical protein
MLQTKFTTPYPFFVNKLEAVDFKAQWQATNSESGNSRRSFRGFTGFPKTGSSTYYSAVPGRAYQTGEELSERGIYSVTHQNHQLLKVVILLRDETFPPCPECSHPASFELVHAAPCVSGRDSFNSRHSNMPVSRTNQGSLHTRESAWTKMRGTNPAEK